MSNEKSRIASVLSAGATALLTVCAVVMTGVVVWQQLNPPPPPPGALQPQPDWLTYTTDGRLMGSRDAPVMMVEFADFECPACRHLEKALRAVRTRYADQFAVVYRHYPLESHASALPAALASECAGLQGRFDQMHAELFDIGAGLGEVPWRELAAKAIVPDLDAFDRCLADSATLPAIERDLQAAARLEARSTPTLLLNGVRIRGAPPERVLDSLIQAALREASARKP
jgi:protein-disulfide isomerase